MIKNVAKIDIARLRAALDTPAHARLIDLLVQRLERGRPLTGALALNNASLEERAAVDSLLGRRSTEGRSLRIDLDELAEILRTAGICHDLPAAVAALRGPVIDVRAENERRDAAWAAMWRETGESFARWLELAGWLDQVMRNGIVKRITEGDASLAASLFADLARLVTALPASGEPLAALAARLFGDAHALDPGTPRATLAVRAAARVGQIAFEDDAEGRRLAWSSVGVACDELSTPVLVFNLQSSADTPLGRLLRTACADALPLHLTLRTLLRFPLSTDATLAGREIFACENPTIVTLAAECLGPRCAPLICVNGQFAAPALVLLRQFRAAGARVRYHGDFDPGGLAIARRALAEAGATPWRYGAIDYLAAPKGTRFTGAAGATPWDEALSAAMRADGRAVHEEAVFPALVADLTAQSRGIQQHPTSSQT